MNRSLTAVVALATALGTAGLAQAQMNPSTSSSPTMNSTGPATTSPTTSPTPGMTSSPSAAQNPSASSTSPQADSQMNRNARQNVSTSEVQQAQQQLKSQGLYNGSIDGVVGPETQTALSQFQRQQGLTVTAQLDQQTMDRLMSGGSTTRPNTDAARAPAPMGTQNPALQNPTTPNQSPGATPYR